MDILPYKNEHWNSLVKKTFTIPSVLHDGASCLYILIKDINEELEEFIFTGTTAKPETDANVESGEEGIIEFRALPNEVEQMMASEWAKFKFVVTYHSQKILYMRKTVTVVYPKISNPKTGMCISLIPWFMLPDRIHPIFVYIYAIWHYHVTGKKSLAESAAATGTMFRIDRFNKSTVSRSIKCLENFIDISKIGEPLATDEPEGPSDKEMIGCVSEILHGFKSVKGLKKSYGEIIKELPKPVKQTVRHILGGIPDKYAIIIKSKEPERAKPRDSRVRPPRARNNNDRRVQRQFRFADITEVDEMRIEFIKYCSRLVMDAAVKHHKFLI